jgi:FHS family L-fucose permease-like MFS transporter
MMGNMMNFLAYLFMGIPAGKLLVKIGYKKTALLAIAVGLLGVFTQYLSGIIGVGSQLFGLPANFYVYLLGAFIAGFSVCMLNTVVNPMLNLLGGGGNKGNQLIQIGGTCNSLTGTLTPMFVGALIGTVTKDTAITDVNLVLFIAMGVFAAAFIILSFIPISDPDADKKKGEIVYERSPWAFLHFVLGAIAIFVYVGIEVGIPGTLNFYLADSTAKGAGILINGGAIGGAIAAIYWLFMLVGRAVSSAISGKVSSRTQLTVVSTTAIILIAVAMFIPKNVGVKIPSIIYDPVEKTSEILKNVDVPEDQVKMIVANPSSVDLTQYADKLEKEANLKPSDIPGSLQVPEVPVSAFLLILCGLCTSVMWGGIFNLATEGLGKYTAAASGIFMMMVVGGGILPLIQNGVADISNYMISYLVPIVGLVYLLYYALIGCKNVNKDIPVE